MFHTEAMSEAINPGAKRRTYAAVLAAVIADSRTSYRLRALIQDDEVLRAGGADDVLLARLDQLVREDDAMVGAREVPPMKPSHTAQERADAFRHANAINRLEGYEPSEEFLALQARVISGEISVDDVVRIAIERAKARDAGKQ